MSLALGKLKLKLFSLILIFFLVACSGKASKSDFLKNKEKYEELYSIIAKYKFEQITYDTVNDLPALDEAHRTLIRNAFKILNIKKIEKFNEGIYFITDNSAIGSDGYFRSIVQKESLENYTILNHINGDWYSWYQD